MNDHCDSLNTVTRLVLQLVAECGRCKNTVYFLHRDPGSDQYQHANLLSVDLRRAFTLACFFTHSQKVWVASRYCSAKPHVTQRHLARHGRSSSSFSPATMKGCVSLGSLLPAHDIAAAGSRCCDPLPASTTAGNTQQARLTTPMATKKRTVLSISP